MTSQTPEHRSLSHIARIIHYFLMWGLDYGFIFGLAIGTMFFPLIGTVIGSFVGIFIGGLYGLIVGAGMSATQDDIAPDTDLDAYGRTLVRRTAGALTAFNLTALPLILIALYNQISQPYISSSSLSYNPYANMVMALGVFSVLISYIVGATARHFPHWMVHGHRLNAPMSHAFVMRHEMETAFRQLYQRSKRRWLWPLVFGIGFGVFLLTPSVMTYEDGIPNWLRIVVLGVPLSFLSVSVGRIYLSLVNAAVLTFIKRVFLRDYFPNLTGSAYRARITVMAFVATWAASWWTFFAAPFIALMMAYFVYQTVALPDEMQEKSKRKEAAASQAQAPSTHRLEERSDDGEIIDLNRLVDPSSIQQKA